MSSLERLIPTPLRSPVTWAGALAGLLVAMTAIGATAYFERDARLEGDRTINRTIQRTIDSPCSGLTVETCSIRLAAACLRSDRCLEVLARDRQRQAGQPAGPTGPTGAPATGGPSPELGAGDGTLGPGPDEPTPTPGPGPGDGPQEPPGPGPGGGDPPAPQPGPGAGGAPEPGPVGGILQGVGNVTEQLAPGTGPIVNDAGALACQTSPALC